MQEQTWSQIHRKVFNYKIQIVCDTKMFRIIFRDNVKFEPTSRAIITSLIINKSVIIVILR